MMSQESAKSNKANIAAIVLAVLGLSTALFQNLSEVNKVVDKVTALRPIAGPSQQLSQQQTEALTKELANLRASLPKPAQSRTFFAIYEAKNSTIYSTAFDSWQSTAKGLPRIIPGRYEVVPGSMQQRFESHRDSQLFVVIDPTKLHDSLGIRLGERFAYTHISKGFGLGAKSPAPHLAFVAVETVYPEANVQLIERAIDRSIEQIQDVLANY